MYVLQKLPCIHFYCDNHIIKKVDYLLVHFWCIILQVRAAGQQQNGWLDNVFFGEGSHLIQTQIFF